MATPDGVDRATACAVDGSVGSLRSVVRRLFGNDGALAIDFADAQVEDSAIAQLHRPVGCRRVDSNGIAPGATTILGAQDPVPQILLSRLGGECGAVVAVGGVRLEAGCTEPTDQDRTPGGLDDAGGLLGARGGAPAGGDGGAPPDSGGAPGEG